MPTAKRAIPIQPLPCGEEWHIAGIVVHTLPDSLPQVRAAIEAITGAEIHAVSDDGKLVVTVEAPTSRAIAAHLTCLHQLEGVLSAALVYQHNEDAAAMNEEMADEDLSS
ncbi:Chaperone NapD (plasmid) [Cupriavidus necator H16]|uniref:Chaperone NapD n=1 Tax=Cupriavidus necator (strain ATCC 17699 / DSM 428 / KCTC 22496 / NCIMB 10442 / H16 / Stanier 337) TaxID=381666 RepID=Q7WXC4_CUPNH|nr:chaperone NapD [Cupriavidus necator]AAP85962.1 periplasmic nitrate reductase accessory protein [Cupriavidus necator H16]QCC05456.1 glutamate synthase [Cupriavidus necator H16]QQB81277.1 chaperone NapD [Cupriavidus necator]